jgi:transcriptional regulator with XRE-family HTH domain
MDICKRVGQNVRQLREAKGLSQEALAYNAKLHRTYLSGLELGDRNATLRVLARIAKALKVEPAELLK